MAGSEEKEEQRGAIGTNGTDHRYLEGMAISARRSDEERRSRRPKEREAIPREFRFAKRPRRYKHFGTVPGVPDAWPNINIFGRMDFPVIDDASLTTNSPSRHEWFFFCAGALTRGGARPRRRRNGDFRGGLLERSRSPDNPRHRSTLSFEARRIWRARYRIELRDITRKIRMSSA
ncbi:hypothetical protein KM043_001453 [Ampulex compressa]|nr:hypothetical protein KM043_001453 [Ampulex compressa]